MVCHSCGDFHSFRVCPYIFYRPPTNIVIARHNFTKSQNRRIESSKYKKKNNLFHSRRDFKRIRECARKIRLDTIGKHLKERSKENDPELYYDLLNEEDDKEFLIYANVIYMDSNLEV